MEDLQKLAHIPLKQVNNRVWRTYGGGALIDKWKILDPLITDEKLYTECFERIKNEIEDAVKFGLDSALPDKGDLLSDV